MVNYLEYITSLNDLLKSESFNKLFKSKKSHICDVYGNYETFINNIEDKESTLSCIIDCINMQSLKDLKESQFVYFLTGKKNYINYFLEVINTFLSYFWFRKDLDIITRIHMSYLYTIHHKHRVKFGTTIVKYLRRQEENNKKIKKKFDDKEIDLLYVYQVDKEEINKLKKRV